MSLREALAADLLALRHGPLDEVEVAVVDSGIDASHPDLKDRVVAAFGVDVVEDRPVVRELAPGENHDRFGHGTGVASIVASMAPNARIVDVRVLGTSNRGTGPALLAGIQRALERRSRVVNLSLAGMARLRGPLAELCERAYRQNQVVVAAKRNVPLTDLGYPAELSTTIGVDRDAFESPYVVAFRPEQVIQFVGHGTDVTVAAAGGGYTSMTGTSYAAPAISAICALLVGRYPRLQPFEIKSVLRSLANKTY